MKALVLYGPNDYKIENDWPMPVPHKGWALVRVAYAGICGSDMPRFFTTGSYHHPMIIGHEFSGIVEQAAEEGKVKKGTPVAILPIIPCGVCGGCRSTRQPFHCERYQFIGSRNDGGFAQYVAVPDENLFVLDSKDQLKIGAMIELLSVGLHVVRRSGIQKDSAIVFGAGPIGLACAMWLSFLGNQVRVTDIREFSLGIARTVGFSALSFDALREEDRYGYAFEASGSGAALQKAIALTRNLGTVTVVGRNERDTVIPGKLFEKLMRNEITLKGCWGYNLKDEGETVRSFLNAFDTSCLITHLISLEEVAETLETVVRPHGEYCKIMVDMEASQ